LKRADSSGDSACHNVDDNKRLSCRNLTMDAFVALLRAGHLTTMPVVNLTGIEDSWDFDLDYTIAGGMQGISENSPILDAVDKQLGLKLELQNIPQPVLVVESVNRNPTPNAADIQKRLPPEPVEFEVASIRPCQSVDIFGGRSSPSGQVTTGCLSLGDHVVNAWNLCTQVQSKSFNKTQNHWRLRSRQPPNRGMPFKGNWPFLPIDWRRNEIALPSSRPYRKKAFRL